MDLIRIIFACFGTFANTIYSHHSLHIRFKIFAQIRIKIFDLMQIHVAANFLLQFFHTGEYLLQNIRLKANIRKTLSEFHIQANICLQIFAYKCIFESKYSHISEYSLHIASNYLEKPFKSLHGLN
jgi:hypothetical protein